MDRDTLTSNTGLPIENDLASMTAGPAGPTLLQDVPLLEKIAHFDRERIPERVVHARGAGAGGYFEVTHDVSSLTRAKFLSAAGKRTEVFTRFSIVAGEKGSADTERDPRGFAVKFYTEEGNFDLVGNNTPVFFIRDAVKFPDFVHSQKRNPATNLKDPDMFWDFLSLTPESVHQTTILFTDRGTPYGYRNMHGFGGHAFQWYDAHGGYSWVKTHLETEQGIRSLTREEAIRLAGDDPDHATRDLSETIRRGEFPAWRVSIQVMTPEAAAASRTDPFDVTKVWPHAAYPLRPIGRLVLDRNPGNYFAEVEQSAFSPGNFVPGIGPSPDRLLQGRLFSYHDTQRHRLGANFHLLPVNASRAAVRSAQRDGPMRTDGNGDGRPNYSPNSFGGPAPDSDAAAPPIDVSGRAARKTVEVVDEDFLQAAALYRDVLSAQERDRLIRNIVMHLAGAQHRIQLRQAAIFHRVSADYGERVARGLSLPFDTVVRLSAMTQAERAAQTR